MTKSYVSLETKQCIVCMKVYDTGTILMDRRFKDSLDNHTCTGIGLCPEHQEKFDEGFVAFIGCDLTKTKFLPNGNVNSEGAYRTGNVGFVKRSLIPQLFNAAIPEESATVFCDDKIITEYLQNIPIEGEENGEVPKDTQ